MRYWLAGLAEHKLAAPAAKEPDRFLTYTPFPDADWNHQRQALECAAALAHALNRTFVWPSSVMKVSWRAPGHPHTERDVSPSLFFGGPPFGGLRAIPFKAFGRHVGLRMAGNQVSRTEAVDAALRRVPGARLFGTSITSSTTPEDDKSGDPFKQVGNVVFCIPHCDAPENAMLRRMQQRWKQLHLIDASSFVEVRSAMTTVSARAPP